MVLASSRCPTSVHSPSGLPWCVAKEIPCVTNVSLKLMAIINIPSTPHSETLLLPTPLVGKLLPAPRLASPSQTTGPQVVSGVVGIVTSLPILVLTHVLMVAA